MIEYYITPACLQSRQLYYWSHKTIDYQRFLNCWFWLNENFLLKVKLKERTDSAQNDQEIYEDANQKLELALDSEKKNSKSAEMKIAEFREELLKVKNEKTKI